MAGLLTSRGEAREYRFEPWEASSYASATWLALLGGAGVAMLFINHPLARILFWCLVAAGPIQLAHLGFTYALTPTELVVHRFGAERLRLPLRDFQRTGGFLGWSFVVFAGRRVVLPFSFSPDTAQFLNAVLVAAKSAGNAQVRLEPVELGSGDVRLPLSALDFASSCVVCGSLASHSVPLEAWRWVLTFREGPGFQLPVCTPHRQVRSIVRYAMPAGVLLLGFVVSFVLIMQLANHATVAGAAIVSLVPGLLLMRVAELLGLDALSDWLSLGIRARALSADGLEITLRVRAKPLRDALIARNREHTERWVADARRTAEH